MRDIVHRLQYFADARQWASTRHARYCMARQVSRYAAGMREDDGLRVNLAGEREPDAPRWRVQFGRFELRGWRAKLLLYGMVVLIACIPGAMAFIAYAEGGTSLWAAVAFTVGVPGGVALYLFWEDVPLRRKRHGSRASR
jgi:hypothetical protein